MNNQNNIWNKNFTILFASNFTSRLGDQASIIGSTLWGTYFLNSGFKVSFIRIFPIFAILFFLPLLGPIVDRFSNKKLLIITDFFNGILLGIMGMLLIFSNLKTDNFFYILILISTLKAIATGIYTPASQAILPKLTQKENLIKANSYLTSTTFFCSSFGQFIGGYLFQIFGAPILFIIDSLSFIFSAILKILIITNENDTQFKKSNNLISKKYILKEFNEGLLYIKNEKGLRLLILITLIMNSTLIPTIMILSFLVKNQLNLEAKWFGYFLGSLTIGSVISSFFSKYISLVKSNKKNLIFSYSILGMSLSMLGMYFTFSSGKFSNFSLFFLFLFGVSQVPISILSGTTVQLKTPHELLGRVSSVAISLTQLSGPIALLLAGFFIDKFSKNINSWFLITSISIILLIPITIKSKNFRNYVNN